ncbi:bifunctional folylpolyglutamate synthase/dihydrofolate synthase [Oenococcus oeni]|uniref:bifunctional folylpolyglutamate synthase/dihydrofolate synthase n=1 Tax=Oenococcus oeni TaxID=1247 RepID=UPI0008F7EEE8|nr:folylpolyglutamate synthase/dihydrofolate synthase family protein [Oenococcus oeni]OIK80838.1 bifunctional folylpolyglutamate synthase/dihydrofolate synthase [Oenococcus oeni]
MIENENEAVEWIHSLTKAGKQAKHDTQERLLNLLEKIGHPEKKLPAIIHVTGTNGKGSVSRFSQAILTASGYRTGLFVSPFIIKFNERIEIDGKYISDDDLLKYTRIVFENYTDQTEFEVITAIAILYFSESHLDALVVEVGIGGLWDSTNVLDATVAVITSVGLDHMDILGDTLAKIAFQKVGIVKPSTKALVYGRIPNEAKDVIEARAKELKIPYGQIDSKLPLSRGYYQRYNAALAWAAVKLYLHETAKADHFLKIIDSWPQDKLIKFLNYVSWPARMEKISKDPLIILDGAHNIQGIATLNDSLLKEYGDREQLIVFGHLKKKNISVASFSDLPLATVFPVNWQAYKETAESSSYKEWHWQLDDLLREIDPKKQMIVVTGSLYFVSQARAYLKAKLAKSN